MTKPISELCTDILLESLSAVSKTYADIGTSENSEPVRFFFRNLETMGSDVSVAFFENLNKRIFMIADLVLKSPHEFWVLSSLMIPAI